MQSTLTFKGQVAKRSLRRKQQPMRSVENSREGRVDVRSQYSQEQPGVSWGSAGAWTPYPQPTGGWCQTTEPKHPPTPTDAFFL